MYSQSTYRCNHNPMPSEKRLSPYNKLIKATTRRREFGLSPSPYRPEHEGLYPNKAERPIMSSTLKTNKWRRGDSTPLPPSPEERHRSTKRPSPPTLSNLPLPYKKRRRLSSPPEPQSRRPICYDDLYPSHSLYPWELSPTPDFYRPSKIHTCDNYDCGGEHSHDDCLLPMRCRGCRSTTHFYVNCTQVCGSCGHTGHNLAYCSEFFVGRDGRSRHLELSRYMLFLSMQACP